VYPVGDAVEECSGESFIAKNLRPLLEGQVGGQDETLSLIGSADHLEEEFGAGLGKGYVPQFVEDQYMEFLQTTKEPLELTVLPCFEKLGDEPGDGDEAYAFALCARGVSKGRGDMALAGTGVAYE
jgi:hypothetical protein